MHIFIPSKSYCSSFSSIRCSTVCAQRERVLVNFVREIQNSLNSAELSGFAAGHKDVVLLPSSSLVLQRTWTAVNSDISQKKQWMLVVKISCFLGLRMSNGNQTLPHTCECCEVFTFIHHFKIVIVLGSRNKSQKTEAELY